jgi:hypothetical protein
MKPRIVRKFNDWSVDNWVKYSKTDIWVERVYNTLKLFPKDKSCFWEPHIWSPINKQKFLEMCNKYNYERKTDCIILSLYYNFINQDIVNNFDHHYIGNSKEIVIKWLNNNIITNIPRHIAWTDAAFKEKRFRDMLDVIVGFNEKSDNKKQKTLSIKNTSLIIVTMTSWVKRIGNVKTVVESIMNNTVKPDRLYLNLSKTEFDGIKLPGDLVDYFNSDDRLIINWVDGENTKCMKKVFPIVKYLNDNDIILPIDDDILYPLDYIEKRVEEYRIHLQPISGLNIYKRKSIYKAYGIFGNLGAGCLFTKKMINHWEEYVDENILKSNNDDTCYAILEWLNGYMPQACEYNSINDIKKTNSYNEIEPSGKLKRYTSCHEVVKLHNIRINELTGLDYKRSFNFYNKKQ